jgi:hypothetical protein
LYQVEAYGFQLFCVRLDPEVKVGEEHWGGHEEHPHNEGFGCMFHNVSQGPGQASKIGRAQRAQTYPDVEAYGGK